MPNGRLTSEPVVVIAAVVERGDRLLVTRRLTGTHLAGYWEFPGGKTEDGEDHRRCLKREMREELDVGVEIGSELYSTCHAYPDRTIELHFYHCDIIGDPKAALGQQVRWVSRADLGALRFPPADLELIKKLTIGTATRSATAGTDAT